MAGMAAAHEQRRLLGDEMKRQVFIPTRPRDACVYVGSIAPSVASHFAIPILRCRLLYGRMGSPPPPVYPGDDGMALSMGSLHSVLRGMKESIDTLHAEKRAPTKETKAMSAASKTIANLAQSGRNVVLRTQKIECPPCAFVPFVWPASVGEDAASGELLACMWRNLKQLPCRDGVVGDHGKLIDARKAWLPQLRVHNPDKGPTGTIYSVCGHPDAVFTDLGAPVTVIQRRAVTHTDSVHWPSVLALSSILFDWKSTTAMLDSTTEVSSQLRLELLSIHSATGRNTLAVATDCATVMRVWELIGSEMIEHVGVNEANLSLDEGLGLLAELLPTYIAATAAFLAAKRRMPVLEEDDDVAGDSDDERGGGGATGRDLTTGGSGKGQAGVEERAGAGASRSALGTAMGAATKGKAGRGGKRRALGTLSKNGASFAPFTKAAIEDRFRRIMDAAGDLGRY